ATAYRTATTCPCSAQSSSGKQRFPMHLAHGCRDDPSMAQRPRRRGCPAVESSVPGMQPTAEMNSTKMTAIDFAAFVDKLATASGETILPFFRTALTVEAKKRDDGAFDPVTAADRAAEAAMRSMIRDTF